MSGKRKLVIALFTLGLVFIPLGTASADIGPKPTMDFTFVQDFPGPPVTIVSGVLDECQQAYCEDAQPLKQEGPQHFSCESLSCDALGYGFSPYERLEITFSDGRTRSSNIFQQRGFNSVYQVTIRPNDLLVEGQFDLLNFLPPGLSFTVVLLACACLVALIVVIGLVVILSRRSRKT